MKTLKLSILGVFTIASFVFAQQETPEDFCKRTAGPNYVPKMDANGVFQGECETSAINICLGTEYTDAKTSKTECCLPPNTVQSASGKQGCCPAGQNFKWDGTTSSCVTPPPPVSCPASNMRMVNRNGQNFQVFCNRAVMVVDYIWKATNSYGVRRAIQGPEMILNDYDSCLSACAANSQCKGANYFGDKKLCSLVTTPPGNILWKPGSLYQLPPPVYNQHNTMAMVPVPRR